MAIVPPLAFGASFTEWFYRALVLLVIACPCALVLSTPVAIVSALAAAARNGILIKGGGPLEALARTHTVMFDKTGTLTVGGARLVAVETSPGEHAEEVLRLAASVEQASHHVVATAIVAAAAAKGLRLEMPQSVHETMGSGLQGQVGEREVRVGSHQLVYGSRKPEDWAVRALRRAAWRSALSVFVAVDGRPIGAWLVTPPGFDRGKKYPLILEIHGGPYAAYGPTFATDMQLYASAGYAVLYTNPRGSTSYGEEFANLIQHRYPGDDYGDLMSAVDAAVATGFIDADRLYVTGGSGGGILTAWIVGKTNRFKAAAAQKPVINWASTVLTTDVATYMPKYWFAKLPWEDPDSYWSRSPLSLVGSVTTPTLVVVGDRDFRTPVSDSEQYYQALQLKGVPTALVKVPDASHGGLAGRPSQSAARVSAILAWFDKYSPAN